MNDGQPVWMVEESGEFAGSTVVPSWLAAQSNSSRTAPFISDPGSPRLVGSVIEF